MRTESKTAGCETRLRLETSMEMHQVAATFHIREARSNGQVWMSEWLSFFVPPFRILEQCVYFI